MASDLQGIFSCPVEFALELLGGKWKTVILARLKLGAMGYGDLRRQIPKLSDKMLSQRLEELSEQGLVLKTKEGIRSTYRLSERGEALRPALDFLYGWGQQMASEVGARIAPASPTSDD